MRLPPKLVLRIRSSLLFRHVARILLRSGRVSETCEARSHQCEHHFVARVAGLRVGDVTLLELQSDCGKATEFWLLSLSVRPAFRRMGFGTLLCRAVAARAAQDGAGSVVLTVRSDNHAAIQLYRSLGFETLPPGSRLEARLDRLRSLTGNRYLAMERTLSAADKL